MGFGPLAGVLGRWWTYDACTTCHCLALPTDESCAGCGALLVGRFSKGHREVEPRHVARVEALDRVIAARERLAEADAADLDRLALEPGYR